MLGGGDPPAGNKSSLVRMPSAPEPPQTQGPVSAFGLITLPLCAADAGDLQATQENRKDVHPCSYRERGTPSQGERTSQGDSQRRTAQTEPAADFAKAHHIPS